MTADMWLDGWGFLIGVAWIAFWVLLILGIVALVRARPTAARTGASGEALRVLEERYARGEISREEFLERRAVLRQPPGTTPGPGPSASP
jgi:putative membrane protein